MTFLTDRSAAETDDTCGMKFWWNRLEAGKGIVPVAEQLALRLGSELHQDMSDMAESKDAREWLKGYLQVQLGKEVSGKEREYLYRRMGWMVAWVNHIEPRIREKYEDVGIEREIALDRSPLIIGVTPDRVLRDKKDGSLVYMEYKSTISASSKWLSSWNYQIQLHLGLKAIEEEMDEKVKFGQIVGFMKGQERDGLLNHPYVYGYNRAGEWTMDYNKARSAGWEKEGVWNYPGGVEEWVMSCGVEEARQQFPFTAPIFLNEKMLNEWIARRTYRERLIAVERDNCQSNLELRSMLFEKRTSKCRPAWGDACPYIRACWNASVEKDPMASGDFAIRVPHHDLEVTWED